MTDLYYSKGVALGILTIISTTMQILEPDQHNNADSTPRFRNEPNRASLTHRLRRVKGARRQPYTAAKLVRGSYWLPRSIVLGASAPCEIKPSISLAEISLLLRGRVKAIQDVDVRLSQAFYDGMSRLSGLKTGLILRDPESVAGYRDMVKKHGKITGEVPVALMGDQQALTLLDSLEGVVYTTPCREFVAQHAPTSLVTQELIYEPVPDDLLRLKRDLRPG